MAGDPQVFALLEEMLDSGKTPEDVCRDHPELLPEVRRRWQEFHYIDAQVRTCLPGIATGSDGGATALAAAGLPQVPGYEVEAVLGHGGMGVVYKARHLALKRTVALKMLAAGHPNRDERMRFRAEAEAAARLQHPNIVQIHEVGEADGRPFIALEYVPGGSLARRLAGQPIPPRDGARLVAALAEAMHLAHSRNLVHRDLKPANVLLAGDADISAGQCQPKVTDFGLVRQLDADSGQTFDGMVIGTPSYMAPEQAEGRAHAAGPSADVYALGAILYECLTGRPPFEGATPLETLEQVRTREPVAPSSRNRQAPRDLESICLKCLRKEPERRYSSARELADDLGRFVRGEPVTARPVGAVERMRKWVCRRPAAAGLLAAVVLLMAVGGAGTWLLAQQWAADRDRRAKTDQNVRTVLERARPLLEKGWQTADLAVLTEAVAEGNRALGMANSGGASAPVYAAVAAYRDDATGRLQRAKVNRTLLKSLLDVAAPLESSGQRRGEAVGTIAPAQPSVDEQYAAAFRRWGLDVDGTPEDEIVARLGAEPNVVVQELIAALDNWMMERRRQRCPEAEWRRLFRVADQLDRSGRHRRLRALLAGGSPPRPDIVAGLLGVGSPWAALWELSRGSDWRQLQAVRADINPASEPVMTVVLLAQACTAVGDYAGAEQVLRQAAAARPDEVVLLDALAKLLHRLGPPRRGNAIEYYRAARARRPGLGIALSAALMQTGRADEAEQILLELTHQQPDSPALYNILGVSLAIQHKFGAAEAAYRKATVLQPNLAAAHYNLGLTLASQGRHGAAEAAARKAIECKPAFAEAHNHLGLELGQQQKHAAAEAAYRKAIELKPEFAKAHTNLSMALIAQGKHRLAEAACRKAIELQPNLAEAYANLSNALMAQEKPGAAEAACRKVIELKPNSAAAYSNLGVALASQRKYRDAEAAFVKATELQPDLADAYDNLGMALASQGQHGAAEAAYRKAVALQPEFAPTYFNLAQALSEQAKFDEALAVIKQGHELLPARDPLRKETRPLLQRCQRYITLDSRLPRILNGAEKPANAAEQVEFAELCRLKQLYAAAARLYAAAFAAEPQRAQDVPNGNRHNAACAAALAGCARGRDKDTLDDNERTRWRRQAREWLRENLTWWGMALDKGNTQTKADVQAQMQFWQGDRDLAVLREPAALEAFSPDERKDCLALWQEVAALLGRTQMLQVLK